jgi:catechol 2,3-dioxygenase-like lactoylglutathione lyase family enzyme
MIRARHIGLVVEDIDRSLEFYQGVFGFPLRRRAYEEPGEYIESLVGIKGVKVEYAKIEIAEGVILELLQYHSHPLKQTDAFYPSNRHGCSHFALTVDDIDEVYNKLIAYGGHCNSRPLRSPDGNVRVFYAHDPDGIILELVQDI